ncbi:unnamed protein product [Paramecium sonneborni]|uniref:Uncharacterized protein n=1 Tax=Paramecium sonneborni TaxID=65129 RepID=A0A8S1MVY4_9CILI|nr:unnamed protein product [Paramecium sonneborni]
MDANREQKQKQKKCFREKRELREKRDKREKREKQRKRNTLKEVQMFFSPKSEDKQKQKEILKKRLNKKNKQKTNLKYLTQIDYFQATLLVWSSFIIDLQQKIKV